MNKRSIYYVIFQFLKIFISYIYLNYKKNEIIKIRFSSVYLVLYLNIIRFPILGKIFIYINIKIY